MNPHILFPLIIAFFFAILLGPIFIPFLKRLKFGQSIREEGPRSHLKKSGTPTMGGIIFIIPALITTAAGFLFQNYFEWGYDWVMMLIALIGFGLIGFIDDFIIVVKKNNDGLRPKHKILAQFIIAAIIFFLFITNGYSTELSILGLFSFDLYWAYGIFLLFWLIGFSNATNLTDGLDGLCGGVSVIVFGVLGTIALFQEQTAIMLLCFTMVGALAGFLIFNLNPAKVFMGDTGSLALGALIAVISILLKQEFLLLIIGFVYVIETASVILQVLYFKKTRKRIFKMAPLHHHFEESGWNEQKVVMMFWLLAILTGALALWMVL